MKRVRRFIVSACLFGQVMSAQADIVVVVPLDNPLRNLTAEQVSDLYLGRTRRLPDGQSVVVLERDRDSRLRERFFHLINGMSLKQINAYWARLQFSGQVLPPPQYSDSKSLLKAINATHGSIGYIDASSVDDSVRVVLRLKDPT